MYTYSTHTFSTASVDNFSITLKWFIYNSIMYMYVVCWTSPFWLLIYNVEHLFLFTCIQYWTSLLLNISFCLLIYNIEHLFLFTYIQYWTSLILNISFCLLIYNIKHLLSVYLYTILNISFSLLIYSVAIQKLALYWQRKIMERIGT